MMTILVLEDEPFISLDLALAVEDAGHHALTAKNNREALAALRDRPVAAAILDVSLGRHETCEPTAAELSRRGIPFLLHTGDLNRVGEQLREFAAPILAKPCPSEDVVGRLLVLLQQAA